MNSIITYLGVTMAEKIKCSECQYFKSAEGYLNGTCELIKDENYNLLLNRKGYILPVKPYFNGKDYLTRTFYWCGRFKLREEGSNNNGGTGIIEPF